MASNGVSKPELVLTCRIKFQVFSIIVQVAERQNRRQFSLQMWPLQSILLADCPGPVDGFGCINLFSVPEVKRLVC